MLQVSRKVLIMQNFFRKMKAKRLATKLRRAKNILHTAIKSQDAKRLKDAILYAHKNVTGETKLMKHARYTYEYLKRREKVVRDVARGMAVVTNTNAIAYGMDILGEALSFAVKYGMTDIPRIKASRKLYENLSCGRKARDLLREIDKKVVISNVAEQDLQGMLDIIQAAIHDVEKSAFPKDEDCLGLAKKNVAVLKEKIKVLAQMDSAVNRKHIKNLYAASNSVSKFREIHGLAHTASMDDKARQVDVLLKLRLFEKDLNDLSIQNKNDESVETDPNSKVAKAAGDDVLGMDADVIQVDDVDLDDDEVQDNDPDTELMDLIRSLKTGSMIEKKHSMQKLRSIAGGEESFARTVRDHKYQHDVKSYRLGIRKDRRRAEDRMKYLKTSPIKKRNKRSNVDRRPGWGVGEQKWFVSKTETPDRKIQLEFNITHGEGVGDIEESKEQGLCTR